MNGTGPRVVAIQEACWVLCTTRLFYSHSRHLTPTTSDHLSSRIAANDTHCHFTLCSMYHSFFRDCYTDGFWTDSCPCFSIFRRINLGTLLGLFLYCYFFRVFASILRSERHQCTSEGCHCDPIVVKAVYLQVTIVFERRLFFNCLQEMI